jgi:LysR family glycine cleavage system transcriptional activator
MPRPLPPLNALRAFEATARHLSFTRAADELAVTPAALSHQIRGLEDYLGRRLFERKTRSIALTEAGAALYPGLHAAFLQIRQSVDLLDRDASTDRVLVVSAPPGFTSKWLAPRLYRFAMAHPDIDVRVSAAREMANFTTDGVDCAVRNARGSPIGLWSRKIADITLLPVVAPKLARELGLASPADLVAAPLIHDDMLGRLAGMPDWSEWLERAGVMRLDLGRGLRFNSPDHALEAAVEGAGVLLGQRELAHDDLRSGRLVAPFPLELATERAFYLVCPSGRERTPKIAAFAAWIDSEVARMEEQRREMVARKADG